MQSTARYLSSTTAWLHTACGENFGLPPPGRRIAPSKKPKQNTQRWRRDGAKTFNENLSKIQAIKS